MKMIGPPRRRCADCWNYLSQSETADLCYSCQFRASATFARGFHVGCTAKRHAQIGVHAAINARAGQTWRNNPYGEIPNDRALLIVAKHGTVKQYLDFRTR